MDRLAAETLRTFTRKALERVQVPDERIFLPGEQSQARFSERQRQGVPVPAPLLATLNDLGHKLGIGKLA